MKDVMNLQHKRKTIIIHLLHSTFLAAILLQTEINNITASYFRKILKYTQSCRIERHKLSQTKLEPVRFIMNTHVVLDLTLIQISLVSWQTMNGWTASPRPSRLSCLALSGCVGTKSAGGSRTNWRCCCRRSIMTAHALRSQRRRAVTNRNFSASSGLMSRYLISICKLVEFHTVSYSLRKKQQQLTIDRPSSIQLW